MSTQALESTTLLSSETTRGARRTGLWIAQIAVAVVFLITGSAKLAGVPEIVATFDKIGVGQWFRYVTALVEVAGAIGLLVPAAAPFAAVALACTMLGAVGAHLLVLGGSAAPAVALLLATLAIAWARRDQIAAAWHAVREAFRGWW